jgi:hypothetical protein
MESISCSEALVGWSMSIQIRTSGDVQIARSSSGVEKL